MTGFVTTYSLSKGCGYDEFSKLSIALLVFGKKSRAISNQWWGCNQANECSRTSRHACEATAVPLTSHKYCTWSCSVQGVKISIAVPNSGGTKTSEHMAAKVLALARARDRSHSLSFVRSWRPSHAAGPKSSICDVHNYPLLVMFAMDSCENNYAPIRLMCDYMT